MLYYTATFLVGAHRLEFHFQNCRYFLTYFGLYILTTINTKNDTRNFSLFVCLRSYNNKSKFPFLETVPPNRITSCLRMSHFLRKMMVSFFSSNIPLYIGKNPLEKLCKVLEMKLKTYIPVSIKFIFEKLKFKVLHYIQHDSIRQRPGLSKDQINMFKSLVINNFILKYRHTFSWLYKR